MKIDINTVAEVLKKNKVEPAVLRQVVEELNAQVEENKAEKADAPKLKAQYVVLVSDPDGKLNGTDLVAWVAQVEVDANPSVITDRIKRAAARHNDSRKGKKYPVATVGQTLQNAPRKFWLQDGEKTLVKTKEPVLVIKTDNKL